MKQLNPYKVPAGRDLDQKVEDYFFGEHSSNPPCYSADKAAAEKVRTRIKKRYGYPVRTGETQIQGTYFARLDTGPRANTEALGETIPLAICRLALVLHLTMDS